MHLRQRHEDYDLRGRNKSLLQYVTTPRHMMDTDRDYGEQARCRWVLLQTHVTDPYPS